MLRYKKTDAVLNYYYWNNFSHHTDINLLVLGKSALFQRQPRSSLYSNTVSVIDPTSNKLLGLNDG